MQSKENLLVMGRITSVYGIKGWVKVYSFTDPMENIFAYTPWKLQLNGQWREIVIDQWRIHGQGLVAHIKGCDDREVARQYCEADINIDQGQLPSLEEGEYYWHQLEGLQVTTTEGVLLGEVDHLMATGANDVLVVRPCAGSVDDQERLIPYLLGHHVKEVSLEQQRLVVDWDPSF
ncbi:ribosome maturation factor RimM [Pokkaliibacter sp. MBI-7]|uniref:ribosome maturation factor RimM n=1 Tax=Pokkaliibacter sp. MBI-7 TaxID=3040600 RepID=UPI00244CA068|nr:ribosome maturation factor RimM [Pokkaliibacter sp. MBI-7]MDH2431965.1 ribosome maturation factor RimM [Pokkaliibacter sp. MBI-7]